jgi:NitT/TauT family transport system substrate-binding protein
MVGDDPTVSHVTVAPTPTAGIAPAEQEDPMRLTTSPRRTSRRRPHLVVAATITALSLVLAACGAGAQGEDGAAAGKDGLTRVKVSWYLPDAAPLLLGVDRGIFEENGLDVQLSEAAPADLVGGLLSGDYDFTPNTGLGVTLAVGKKVPIVAAAALTTFEKGAEGSSGSMLLTKKGSSITRPRDLEGKRVAVNILASASEYGVRKLIDEDGGDNAKTKIVEVPFASMGDTLLNGDIDAFEVSEPFVTQLLATGKFDNPMGDPIELVFGPSPRLVMTTLKSYAASNPEVVDKFRASVDESIALAEKDPDALHPIYEKYYKMDPALAEATTLNKFKTELTASDFDRINEILLEFGALEKAVPSDQLVP